VQRHSIDKSMQGGATGCQMLHITKFKGVRFEFLVGQIGFCNSKHAQYCHTCEKMPQNSQYVLQNIKIFTLKKINCKLNLMKRNLDKPSQSPRPPTPYVGNCQCVPLVLHQILRQLEFFILRSAEYIILIKI